MTRIIKNPGRGYSGREKINLYHYDSDGKFLKTWDSQQELRNEYFPNESGKRPLINNKRWKLFQYDVLPDGTFYCLERLGREKIKKYERIFNSKYCVSYDTKSKEKAVEVYNLCHEKIGEFKSAYLAHLLLNIPLSTITKSADSGKGQSKNDLYFKYK